MDDLPPVFYAPSLDYYVVTRYADIERVFLALTASDEGSAP